MLLNKLSNYSGAGTNCHFYTDSYTDCYLTRSPVDLTAWEQWFFFFFLLSLKKTCPVFKVVCLSESKQKWQELWAKKRHDGGMKWNIWQSSTIMYEKQPVPSVITFQLNTTVNFHTGVSSQMLTSLSQLHLFKFVYSTEAVECHSRLRSV